MTLALVCVALLGVLVFALGFGVSLTRGRSSRAAGFPEDPADPLYKIVRAHGNTTEYAAMLAVLILLVGSREPGAWAKGAMVVAVAGRYLIAAGILLGRTLAEANPLRFVGALSTYVAGFALCGALLASL